MQSSVRPAATPVPRSKAPSWPAPGHIQIFINNLRLLEFDRYADAPNLSLRTFSSSQQNQRQRIKAVEWALYRLFALWDPEGTNSKLRPFFPPLEPLQSLNLRAALFRVLSDVKKNGFLGREVILRKTMLDDCKGEKFEEALAAFSTAVLRRTLLANGASSSNPTMRLAIASTLAVTEQEQIIPLILAHRSSMNSTVAEKARLQGHYNKLGQLLDAKAASLAARAEQTHPATDEAVQNADAIDKEVREAWLDNDAWADIILHGGMQRTTDLMLERPFAATWSSVNRGSIEDVGRSTSKDLLSTLNSRLAQQKSRLEKWQEFKNALDGGAQSGPPSTRGASANPLLFRDHQSLTATSLLRSTRRLEGGSTVGDQSGHDTLIKEMEDALARMRPTLPPPREYKKPQTLPEPAVQRDDRATPCVRDSVSPSPEPEASLDSIEYVGRITPPRVKESGEDLISQLANSLEGLSIKENKSDPPPPSIQIQPDTTSESPDTDSVREMPHFETQTAAGTTLLERTRRSMSFLPAPSAQPQASKLGRDRHVRQSQTFPVNQFETPTRPRPEPIARASTPHEELFNREDDYASVFKSRPKIATSPVVSPMVHLQSPDHMNQSLDLSLDELDVASSPLGRRAH